MRASRSRSTRSRGASACTARSPTGCCARSRTTDSSTRDAAGRIQLGARMAALAAGVAHDLQAEALPELTAVANELGTTCFLVVLDHDECVTLVSVEPRHAVASVAQRPGTRHPVTVGAPGKAILSVLPPASWPAEVSETLRTEVADAAARGLADEPRRGHPEPALGVRTARRARATAGRDRRGLPRERARTGGDRSAAAAVGGRRSATRSAAERARAPGSRQAISSTSRTLYSATRCGSPSNASARPSEASRPLRGRGMRPGRPRH